MLILKQSTAIDIRMGPFLDATDGVTPETGITLGAADQAEVLKANGAATAAMAGTFAAVTGSDGWYDYTASTTDTNTVGEVVFVVQDSSVCLPVFVRAHVVEEAIYDALFAASATGFDANGRVDVGSWLGTAVTTSATSNKPEVDVNSISDDATAANNAESFFDGTGYAGTNNVIPTVTTLTGHTAQTGDSYARLGAPAGASVSADIADVPTVSEFNARTLAAASYFDPATDTVALVTTVTNLTNQSGVIASGTAQAVTATTIQLASGETFADDEIIGSTVLIDTASTGAGQSRVITDYVSSTDTATVDTWTTTPTGTITYEIFATAPSSSTALPDVNMAQISGSATAADNLEASALGIVPGSCEGTPTTTVIQTDLAEATDDHYIGRVIVFTSGSAAYQATDITDYTGATGTVTVTALTTAPSASDTFVIV